MMRNYRHVYSALEQQQLPQVVCQLLGEGARVRENQSGSVASDALAQPSQKPTIA
jgi:hypothetical protein